MTYPEIHANSRTDISFKNKLDEELYTGDSPFIDTQSGMISLSWCNQNILITWIRGPLCNRVGQHVIESISDALVALKGNVPCEFARKPNSL